MEEPQADEEGVDSLKTPRYGQAEEEKLPIVIAPDVITNQPQHPGVKGSSSSEYH